MLDPETAAGGFSALGNPVRLRIFRILVTAGHEGLPIGFIQEKLDIPLTTLAHHLAMLVKAGLVAQEKRGRQVICRANFHSMNELIAYLTEHCCAGVTTDESRAPKETRTSRVTA